jgi:Rrf2 family protein
VKISYKGDYALKAVFELALKYYDDPERVVPINEIAKFGDMPKKFLEQILLTLSKGGFVKSKRGINGGFYLARPPQEITIGDVIRFIEGPIEPIACVKDGYHGCKDTKSCILRGVWKEVAHSISVVIDSTTFEELILRYKQKTAKTESVYEYAI